MDVFTGSGIHLVMEESQEERTTTHLKESWQRRQSNSGILSFSSTDLIDIAEQFGIGLYSMLQVQLIILKGKTNYPQDETATNPFPSPVLFVFMR